MHRNNFDFLRLVFALFVIITHSYFLTGLPEYDMLDEITGGQVSFSYLGITGFFIISGYLVYQSLQRSSGLADYFYKRILRIFPALSVVLFITVILGVFVYSGSVSEYFKNSSVWTYIPNNLKLFGTQSNITGIFESNPFKPTINGSLWTLQYEFFFYIFLTLFLFIKRGKIIVLSSIVLLFFIAKIFLFDAIRDYKFVLYLGTVIDFGSFFLAGALLAMVKFETFRLRKTLMLTSALLIIVSLAAGLFYAASVFFWPILVIAAGASSAPFINKISKKFGDPSYGIYIYAYPVQQTLVYFFHPEKFTLMISAAAIASLLGYLSWHLVEKPALGYKKFFDNGKNNI